MTNKPYKMMLLLLLALVGFADAGLASEAVKSSADENLKLADGSEKEKSAEEAPFTEAENEANVKRYGQSYMATFKELKAWLKDDDSKILDRLSNAELLEVSWAIEQISRPILEDKISKKVKSAEASVPSLFNGMMVFAAGLGFLAIFCLRKTMVQSLEIRKMRERIEALSGGSKPEASDKAEA